MKLHYIKHSYIYYLQSDRLVLPIVRTKNNLGNSIVMKIQFINEQRGAGRYQDLI